MVKHIDSRIFKSWIEYLVKANLFQGTKLSKVDLELISKTKVGLDAGIASELTLNCDETYASISIDSRKLKYGYWSHLFFAGIDRVRKDLSNKEKFFECSGYLFAIRKGVILDFPLGASEDSIIPFLFWKKGYKIKYIPKAEVYVKNPDNWKDWLSQKIRNIKGHETLERIAPDLPRTKSLFNEIKWGALFALTYPRSFNEVIWTIESYFARIYLYFKAFKEIKMKTVYRDGWRETEISSTKPLDWESQLFYFSVLLRI